MAAQRNGKKQFDGSSLKNYIEVDERIQDFYVKYPDGRLKGTWKVADIDGHTFVVYTALAYRTPDDPLPCVGTAAEQFPGTTPYTRNSEVMNAETSAWGRAIVAAGIPAKGSLASANEVRNRQAEQAAQTEVGETTTPRRQPKAKPGPPSSGETEATKVNLTQLRDAFTASGLAVDDLRWHLTALGVEDTADTRAAMRSLSDDDRAALMAEFQKAIAAKAAAAEADAQIPMEA